MIDQIQASVAAAFAGAGLDQSHAASFAQAIANSAITEADTGLKALALDRKGEKLIRFDLAAAVAAAAGSAATVIPLVLGGPTVVAALAAIGALGAIKGIRSPLPIACAYIVDDLWRPKSMDMDKLKVLFLARKTVSHDIAEHRFTAAMEQLEHLGCLEVRDGRAVLKERVLARW